MVKWESRANTYICAFEDCFTDREVEVVIVAAFYYRDDIDGFENIEKNT
jgi:hypothetical protein